MHLWQLARLLQYVFSFLFCGFTKGGRELEYSYLAYASLSSRLHMEVHLFLTLQDYRTQAYVTAVDCPGSLAL